MLDLWWPNGKIFNKKSNETSEKKLLFYSISIIGPKQMLTLSSVSKFVIISWSIQIAISDDGTSSIRIIHPEKEKFDKLDLKM